MKSHLERAMPTHDAERAGNAAQEQRRRPYTPPQLDVYGPIQALTLGGSIGVGESGMPNRKPLNTLGLAPNLSDLPTSPTDPSRQ